MINFLLSLFTFSLVYLSLYTRVKRYVAILAVQGLLLFCIAINILHALSPAHLVFILVETLLVKAIAIPVFLSYIRKRNNLSSTSQSKLHPFFSVLVFSLAIIFGFLVSQLIQSDHLQKEIFAVAIICIISGLFFIIIHLNIFTHLVGYLVIENGVFLLALALGTEIPIMVSLAILFDILVGVIILGVFINRIGDKFKQVNLDQIPIELLD